MSNQRLDLHQSQSLVMTQQLQQSIKLLQLSSQELVAYINQELEINPLLTQQEPGGDEEFGSTEGEGNSKEQDAWGDDLDEERADFGQEEESQYYEQARHTTSASDGVSLDFEDNEDCTKTLRQHLIEQIYVDITDPAKRIIAFHLTDLLDDNGYLTEVALDEVAAQLGSSVQEVEETLSQIQAFDPAGVYARSLAECLGLQLKDKNRFDPAMESLLNHLELLAKGELAALRRVCAVSAEDLADMISEIKALNPKPGLSFAPEQPHALQPDVFLRRANDGSWLVELNSDILPRLLVNRRYYSYVRSKSRGKDDKKYLSEQLHTANWLIKALDQRAQTILKVSTEIVAQQQDFFTHGIRYLKPLKLSDIALQVSLHESTVSRVTTNKYLATPLGLFELKYFFSSSLQNEGEESYSSKTVKYLIKQLIDKEPANAVLSDEMIAEILQKQHIPVARRTVAKYREAMHIPSSAQRKREKRLK